MPYGNDIKNEEATVSFYINNSHFDDLIVGQRPEANRTNWSRDGTNQPKISMCTRRSSANAVYEWVPTLIRKGPKLLGYEWSKRLKKMVRRRAVSSVSWRLVRKKSPLLKKPLKGLDLPPNPLNYVSHRTSYFGINAIRYRATWDNSLRDHRGDLTQAFRPSGGPASLGPNPMNYSAAPMSGQLQGLVNEIDEKARTRLYAKMKNQHVNLAQALAERGQVSKMLVEIAQKLFKFWVSIKKGNLWLAAQQLFPHNANQLADVHLMYRYGIMPLVEDLKGIVQVLATDQDVYFEIDARSKGKLERTVVSDQYSVINGVACRTRIYLEGECKVIYKYRVRIASAYDSLVRNLASLGFSNPNSLAYELTPFSFVVDWFIPIGNYLNTVDAFDGLTVDSATKTIRTKQYYVFEREFVDEPLDPNFRMVYGGLCGFVSERFSNQRVLLTSLPDLPKPDFSMTTKMIKRNAATALALIVQLKR